MITTKEVSSRELFSAAIPDYAKTLSDRAELIEALRTANARLEQAMIRLSYGDEIKNALGDIIRCDLQTFRALLERSANQN